MEAVIKSYPKSLRLKLEEVAQVNVSEETGTEHSH